MSHSHFETDNVEPGAKSKKPKQDAGAKELEQVKAKINADTRLFRQQTETRGQALERLEVHADILQNIVSKPLPTHTAKLISPFLHSLNKSLKQQLKQLEIYEQLKKTPHYVIFAMIGADPNFNDDLKALEKLCKELQPGLSSSLEGEIASRFAKVMDAIFSEIQKIDADSSKLLFGLGEMKLICQELLNHPDIKSSTDDDHKKLRNSIIKLAVMFGRMLRQYEIKLSEEKSAGLKR